MKLLQLLLKKNHLLLARPWSDCSSLRLKAPCAPWHRPRGKRCSGSSGVLRDRIWCLGWPFSITLNLIYKKNPLFQGATFRFRVRFGVCRWFSEVLWSPSSSKCILWSLTLFVLARCKKSFWDSWKGYVQVISRKTPSLERRGQCGLGSS